MRAQNRPNSSFRISREEVSPVSRRADSVRSAQQAQGYFVGWSKFQASLPLRAPDSSSLVKTGDAVVKARHSTLLSRAYASKTAVSYSSTKYAKAERMTPICGSLPTEAQRRFVGLKEPLNSIYACMGNGLRYQTDQPDSREKRTERPDRGPGITVEEGWVRPSHFGRPIAADCARAKTLQPVGLSERYAALEEETE